ncbi:hypothetical protein [Clostridium psychrophilum]|uniref:hypothetical protein n=1 Tax=Clostridium psychrophilum TaxID=132926 RepID=UPI001C0E11CC|nr:hypothetical protein [Clostridium psychrophilum]MBU3182882.1 hypothetical protein [Clostridium psychrophilum]
MRPMVPVILVIIILLCSLIGKKYNLGKRFPKSEIVLNIALVIVVLVALYTIFFS